MKNIFAGKKFAPGSLLSTRKVLQRIKSAIKDVKPLADWVRVHVGARPE